MRRAGTATMPVEGIKDSATSEPADLVLRNGRIHTGDAALPEASAVAVRGGRLVAVGEDDDVIPLVGRTTRVIDLRGRRAIPGLNDSHLHLIRGGGNYALELRWDGVRSLHDALEMLRDQAGRTPAGQWIRVVGGWSADQFAEGRPPSLSELNAAAPNTPVFVLNLYQSAQLNAAALRATGIGPDTPDPAGGQIVRGASGQPTGLLLATPSAAILYSTLAKGPVLDPDEKVQSTRQYFRELNRFGITSALDPAGGFQNFPDDYDAVMSLERDGELTVRIGYFMFPQTAGQEIDDLRRWISMTTPGEGSEWLRLCGAGENLAWSPADFENFAEPRPRLAARAPEELEAAVRLLLEHHWGFRLHATYDQTIDSDLGVFEKVRADGLWPDDLPWLFDHAETVTPANLDRIKALGGRISVQNRMMFQGREFLDRYGPAAARTAPPIRAMLDAGLEIAGGTDATRVSSYNPWLSLAWFVSGRTIGGVPLGSNATLLSREEALRAYTLGGAVMSGESDVKGTIRVGNYADLAVLSADYFAVPVGEIADIESVLTVVGGRIVHASADFEGQAAPAAPIEPAWSPVARFGGYHRAPGGFQQAMQVADAAADSADQLRWRRSRGEHPAVGNPFEQGC